MGECREVIQRVWSKQGGSNAITFQRKLQNCFTELSRWNRIILDGSLRGAIVKKEAEIRDLSLARSGN